MLNLNVSEYIIEASVSHLHEVVCFMSSWESNDIN